MKATKIVGTAGIMVGLYFWTALSTSVNGGSPALGSGMHTSRLPDAQAAYERNHWQSAFDALARLADAGHADAARWAWLHAFPR